MGKFHSIVFEKGLKAPEWCRMMIMQSLSLIYQLCHDTVHDKNSNSQWPIIRMQNVNKSYVYSQFTSYVENHKDQHQL